METQMDTYSRIDYLLKKRKVTRKAMCEEIGVPYNTYNSMLKRRSGSFDIETLRKISDYLGVSIDFLVRFSVDEEEKETELLQEFTNQQASAMLNEMDENTKRRFLVALNNIVISLYNIDKAAQKHGIEKPGSVVVLLSKVLEGMYVMEASGRSLSNNVINGEELPLEGKEWELIWFNSNYEKSAESLLEYKKLVKEVIKVESRGSFEQLCLKANLMRRVPRERRMNKDGKET